MPNVRISFHPAAAVEVEAALQWYKERSPVAAQAFAAEVNACVERVREAPDRWPRYVHGTRRYLLPHFPFSLVYRVRNGDLEIVAVAHHRGDQATGGVGKLGVLVPGDLMAPAVACACTYREAS